MKITCTRPNASANMNGIAFEPHPDGGMVSVNDVEPEMAKIFLSLEGFNEAESTKTTTLQSANKEPVTPNADENHPGDGVAGADGNIPADAKTDAAANTTEAATDGSGVDGAPVSGTDEKTVVLDQVKAPAADTVVKSTGRGRGGKAAGQAEK